MVELDFLVGTVNPILLLVWSTFSGWDEGCVRIACMRTGFVGFSRFFGYTEKLGPVLPVTGHWIGLHLRGGA